MFFWWSTCSQQIIQSLATCIYRIFRVLTSTNRHVCMCYGCGSDGVIVEELILRRVGLGKKQFTAGSSLTHKELPISWWPLPGPWEGDFMGWQSLWCWHGWRGAVSEVKVAEGWRRAELSYGDLTAEWRAEQRERVFLSFDAADDWLRRVDVSRLWLDQDNKLWGWADRTDGSHLWVVNMQNSFPDWIFAKLHLCVFVWALRLQLCDACIHITICSLLRLRLWKLY